MMEIIKSLFLSSVFLFVITVIYFIALEQWCRHRCKIGKHAGHIKDGKLVCHTCFAEVDVNG